MKKVIIAAFAALIYLSAEGQVTQANNNPVFGNYVGFDNTSIDPLPIQNQGFPDIDISSNGNNKFAITELGTWNGLNGLTRNNVQRTTMGLQGQTNLAWSMLHLWDDAAGLPGNMIRPWMNVGTSYTTNWDYMYVGMLERPEANGPNLQTDAVVAWGCQDGVNNNDNFRFIFIAPQTGSAPSQSVQGLETMRITPWGNVGIGDSFNNSQQPHRRAVVHGPDTDPQFRISTILDPDPDLGDHADFQVSPQANLHIKPRHNEFDRTLCVGFLDNELDDPTNDTRLDVGGLTRIRTLTNDADSLECLIVGYSEPGVNDTDPEDQFLRRIDFPDDETLYLDGTGEWTSVGDDCRWQDNSTSTSSNPLELDIYTGFDPGNDCYRGKVGIGVKKPQVAKAEVYMINDELGNFTDPIRNDEVLIGTFSRTSSYVDGNNGSIYVAGVKGQADCLGEVGSTQANIGVHGIGLDSRFICGVFGEGRGLPQSTGNSFGVRGEASGGTDNYGVYGEVFTSAGSDHSGYFVGGTFVSSGTPVLLSDQSIKSEINDLTGATETLNSLSPKTYFMQSPESRPIAFEPDLQYGLIAQEVQDVLPDLVHETTVPAMTDTSGVILDETEVTLLGLQYDQLIPILIAGFNEQSGQVAEQAQTIEDQEGVIEELENQIADLSASLGQLQESVAQLNDVAEQNQAKSNDCCEKISNLIGDAGTHGKQSSLEQNVPNPFQESTQIDYNLASNGRVRLIITNELAQPIETLVNGELS